MKTTNHKLIQMKTQQEEQIGLANLWIAVNKYRIKNNEHKILQDAYLAGYKVGCRHSKLFAEWISSSEWVLSDFKGNKWMEYESGKMITTDELYDKFLSELK